MQPHIPPWISGSEEHETLTWLDEAALPATIVDPSTRQLRRVNDALARLLGATAAEIEQAPISSIVHEGDHALVASLLDAVVEGRPYGPVLVTMRSQRPGPVRPSLWVPVKGFHDDRSTALTVLCQPLRLGDGGEDGDRAAPGDGMGFGRIPPLPSGW